MDFFLFDCKKKKNEKQDKTQKDKVKIIPVKQLNVVVCSTELVRTVCFQ